jgi:hypothetical protein
VAQVTHQYHLPAPPREARELMTGWRGLESRKFYVGDRPDNRIVYIRHYWSGWIIAICILLFPIGLLALLSGRTTDRITFEFEPEGGGSLVHVYGTADKNTCRAIQALGAPHENIEL